MYEREEAPRRRRRRRRRRRSGLLRLLTLCLLVFVAAGVIHAAMGLLSGPEDGLPLPKDANQSGEDLRTPPAQSLSVGALEPAAPQPAAPSEPAGQPSEPSLPQPEVPTVETPEEPGEVIDPESWNLLLVNPWNAMPKDYDIDLKELSNGHRVDERCYDALQEMLDACRAAGLQPLICSSYRTWEKQESLYQNKVQRLMNQGYSQADALVEAGKAVAVPGTSEHQLGLAVDIVDVANQNLDESQERTAVQRWLMEHSYEYGFILRYPNDKSETTGIIYEPWHYRYVGETAARAIYDQGVCLEEYLASLEQ